MNMEKAEIKTNFPPLSTLLMDLYKSKWIKCEDALPNYNNEVLVVAADNGNAEIRIGFYSLGTWYTYTDDDKLAKVTHWMPLPELPKD
jgi:hypothetical protein|nr:MAG TPA: Protein of unknown function (DUF551) [Caudoviricetes sp.]